MKKIVRAIRDFCLPAHRMHSIRGPRRTIALRKRRAICEQLESRQLLSVDGFMLDRGVLEFHGADNVAEAVSLDLSVDQSQVLATVNAGSGPQTTAFDLADVEHFRFVGREMADTIVNNSGLQTEVLMSHGHHGHGRLSEMEAMLDLVRYGDVTRTPVQSGKWFDAATWGGAENMPVDGDRVLVPEGQTLVVNGVVDGDLMTVRVDGTLKFAHWKNTELRVDTIVVGMKGELVMGTEAQPIRSQVTAKLVINDFNGGFETADMNSPDYDPYQLGNGLISHGQSQHQRGCENDVDDSSGGTVGG